MAPPSPPGKATRPFGQASHGVPPLPLPLRTFLHQAAPSLLPLGFGAWLLGMNLSSYALGSGGLACMAIGLFLWTDADPAGLPR